MSDRQSSRAWLIDNVLLSALELLDPEVDTWECLSSIARDSLKPHMKLVGPASFLPEEREETDLRQIKSTSRVTQRGTMNIIHERMKLNMRCFLSLGPVDFVHHLRDDYRD
jgi:hypothetical protein